MGIIRNSMGLIVGAVCGVYIAQNYDVPNIKDVATDALIRAKILEEKYRRKPPSKPRDN